MGHQPIVYDTKLRHKGELDDHGIESAIVSFNNKETITEALRSTGLLRYFEDETDSPCSSSTDIPSEISHSRMRIFGSEAMRNNPGLDWNKSKLISEKFLEPRELTGLDLVFVDDNCENCDDVRDGEGTRGAEVIHVEGGRGMTKGEMTAVLAWAELTRRVDEDEEPAGRTVYRTNF